MASPDKDSNKPGPKSPPVQESPIFGYVSSLSPIQPVNARSTVQVYENIDVPSPQVVFKTPTFIRPRSSIFPERSHHLVSASSENLSPGYSHITRGFSDNMNITQTSISLPTQLISCGDKEITGCDPSPNQSCTSPNCIDAFLADPSENGDSSSCSPEFCVKRAAKDLEVEKSNQSEGLSGSLNVKMLQDQACTDTVSTMEQKDDSMQIAVPMAAQDLHQEQDFHPPCTSTSHRDCSIAHQSATEFDARDLEKNDVLVGLRQQYQMEEDTRNGSLAAQTVEISNGSLREQTKPECRNSSIYTNAMDKSGPITQHRDTSVSPHVMDLDLESRLIDCVPHNEEENTSASGSLCYYVQGLGLQIVETDQSNDLDFALGFNSGSFKKSQTIDRCIDNLFRASSGSTGDLTPYDQEDGTQHLRGKRKRLQFEAAENYLTKNRSSSNCTTEAPGVGLPTSLLELETAKVASAESVRLTAQKQMIQSVSANLPHRFLVNIDGSYRENPVTAPRLAGIGLHLNSIGNSASINSNSNIQLPEENLSIQEEKIPAEDDNLVSQKSKNYSSLSLTDPENLTLCSEMPLHYAGNESKEEKQQRNQPFQHHSFHSFQSSLSISVPTKLVDRYMTPCITKRLPSEEVNKSEESTQINFKKRKKTPESHGPKRCNCKRSKCLKLYCDCFAAGSFCSEACACRECSNRLEYEETVRDTRQQIESRNPLAFAPKVILRAGDQPKDTGDTVTPSSARHKRGCNCKKSLCLKKYCECFQAGVGCSFGCRCEGCKNTYGTKDGCEISEMALEHKRHAKGGRDLSDELECIEVKGQVASTNKCRLRLSPITPLIGSSAENDVPIPRVPSSYYPSPESAVRSYDSSGAALDVIQKGAAEDRPGSSSSIPYNLENEPDHAGKPYPLSPEWEGFREICNFSSMLHPSLTVSASSSPSKTGDRKTLQMKLFPGSSRISLGSVRWHTSPFTPLPQLGERKLPQEPDSESSLHCDLEDDTPDILKEARPPISSIKSTSPNQKRVSPPHQDVHPGTNANSPPGPKTVRKFILQSVPAFPPLSPYSKGDKKDGT